MKKKVLVTGHSGFVGNHLCEFLIREGVPIINNEIKPLDVTSLEPLLSVKDRVGTIIHLAAKTSVGNSLRSPYDTYYTNIVGTLNLLEYARQNKVKKFIITSTYVYGQPQYIPIDEKHPIDPTSPYNKSKVLAEKLCQYFSEDFKIDIVILRPFYLYGPAPRANSFIDCILSQIKEKNGRVRLSGKYTRRDFLFIDDFLNLIKKILNDFPRGYNVYNVGYGKSNTLSEAAQIIAKHLGKKITITYDNRMRPDDITEMVADTSKISRDFDWKPSTSLEEGLQRTVRDFG